MSYDMICQICPSFVSPYEVEVCSALLKLFPFSVSASNDNERRGTKVTAGPNQLCQSYVLMYRAGVNSI